MRVNFHASSLFLRYALSATIIELSLRSVVRLVNRLRIFTYNVYGEFDSLSVVEASKRLLGMVKETTDNIVIRSIVLKSM